MFKVVAVTPVPATIRALEIVEKPDTFNVVAVTPVPETIRALEIVENPDTFNVVAVTPEPATVNPPLTPTWFPNVDIPV